MNFLYLNSDRMGVGDDALGRTLIKSFLQKIIDAEHRIDVIGCVNSGIFLTCEGSPVLAQLQTLQDRGAQISSCGTCLEYYGQQDQLRIGQVGTMAQSVAMMMQADRVIQP